MRYLKTWEQISKNRKIDSLVSDWCDEVITESQFFNAVDDMLISEGISDVISGLKEKIVDMFWTFVVKAYQLGFSIWEKVGKFFTFIIGKINQFRKKHPKLFRFIVITLIVIIILIVTASSAHAAQNGAPVPAAKIDMAIGWLDTLKSGSEDTFLINKAITHLIDLRDGQVDIQGLGEGSINMANAALKVADEITQSSKTETDPQFFKFCVGLIEKGRDYIDVIYTKTPGFESVSLIVK